MLKSNERYTVTVDMDLLHPEDMIISVDRRIGSRTEHINTIKGEEAKALYEKITNKEKNGGNENE